MSRARRVVRGGAAGAAATVVMSAVMAAAHRVGLLGEPPPRAIARAAAGAAHTDADAGALDAAAVLAHLAFGIAAGAVYGGLRPALPRGVPRPVAGAAFGLAVWAVSYSGWVPALGILPPPTQDRPGRQPTMVLAHLVYGAALDVFVGRR